MRSGCRGQLRWSPLLLGFMGLFLAACEAPPLAVTFGGCPYLRANSVCEVNYGIDGQLEELRLLVKTSPQADITVFQGRKSLPARIERTDLGRLVRVRPLPGVSGLTIVARKGIAWRRQDLVVREWTASDWVQKAFDTWAYRGNPEAAKRDLQERLEREPPRFDDEAWARGFLARIALEGNQIAEGENQLRKAIQLDHKAMLIANEIRDSFRLKEILANHEHRFEEAEHLMDGLEEIVSQDISNRSWLELNRGLIALEQDRPAEVLKHAERGVVWAVGFGDREALSELNAMKAEALQLIGRTQEAAALFKGLADREPSPCRRAELLMRQGRVQRLTLEGVQKSEDTLALEQPLQAALQIYKMSGESGCSHRRQMRRVLLELAQVALLRQNSKESQEWLKELQSELSKAKSDPNKDLDLQLIYMNGRLALQQSRQDRNTPAEKRAALDSAKRLFEQLEMQSLEGQKSQSTGVAKTLSFNESHWQALVGIAEVQREMNERQAALRSCRQADEYLATYSQSLPLGASRGGFLGRHERGSSLCLALFVELNQLDAAFAWLRQIRVRALYPVLGLLNTAPDAQKLTNYRDLRQKLDDNAKTAEMAAKDEMPALRKERSRLYGELLASVEGLAGQPPLLAALKFKPLVPGELSLICHPALAGGWLCIAATAEKKKYYFVKKLGKGVSTESVSNELLVPIAPMLRNVHVVRVLPYGDEMRSETDIHLLPYSVNGRTVPLWESGIDVVYAVDLPVNPLPADATSSKVALMVVDPQQEFAELRKAAGVLETAFSVKDWQTIVQTGGEQTYGNWPNKRDLPPQFALGAQLRSMLLTVDLFLYMGHSSVDRAAGWTHSLHTAREAGLLVSDILLLPRVPRRVVLLGCQTAQSSEETGGQEALGIAQSFVARGAEAVLSTPRQVTATWAATVVRALSQQGLTANRPDLVDVLRRSITELRSHAANQKEDLGAFRVIVP